MRQERIGRELEKHDIGKIRQPCQKCIRYCSERRLDLADAQIKGSRAKGSSSRKGEIMRDFGERGHCATLASRGDVDVASCTAGKQTRVDLPKPMRLPGKTDMAADMLLDEA
jgi:hypothetical protein